jgi:hypothetical protein
MRFYWNMSPSARAPSSATSTKLPGLETADQLLRRIDDASKYVPVDQLALRFASGCKAIC